MATKGSISRGLTLYTAGTPNGWKVSVLLKELKYPHTVRPVSISGEVKEEWFLKINPNGRIPAIVDHDNGDLAVFETGACMMYIAEKAGELFPQEWDAKYDVVQWLMWQMGGLGPMQGQANHFVRFAPEKLLYPMTRYQDETKRLLSVLESQLSKREWLAAGEYTIADIASFSWVICAPFCGVDVAEFPAVKAWMDKIYAREAVKEGLAVPSDFMLADQYADAGKMKEMMDVAAASVEEARKAKEASS